jgi:hypothetical protein
MTRRQKDPLRDLTEAERDVLESVRHARADRAERVARATGLLAVADGASYTAAAQRAGRRSGDGVAQLVARFNALGLAALDGRHGGGPAPQYGATEQERTATWSLTTLQPVLRRAPDGLPHVSTFTILQTLHEADYSYLSAITIEWLSRRLCDRCPAPVSSNGCCDLGPVLRSEHTLAE